MSDIQKLFQEDPLNLTRENIDSIIDVYRKARHLFEAGAKSAGSTKKIGEPVPKIKTLDLSALLAKK